MNVTAPNDNQPVNKRKSWLLWGFTLFLLILGVVLLFLWYFYWQFHQTTDDAYASGSLVYVNSPIEGSVAAFYADNTDLVIEGQLLAKLDPTYNQLSFNRALAALGDEALAVKQLYDRVPAARADVEVKKAALSQARYDYQNRAALIGTKAVTNEEYVHAQDEVTIAENQLKRAEAELKVAEDAAGDTPFEKHPRVELKIAELKERYYYLKHSAIYAPATGYVVQRSVNVGDSVTRTKPLMGIVPTDYVWVDANFKETQLKHMRVGQPAKVWFDLYGSDVVFEGKVLGIASGTGSVFSLIPPQNATGNWIKIVQRLPVRIGLDPEMVKKYPLRLGLSAEADVDISNQNLPYLVQTPVVKPVATTRIYEIGMGEVDKMIESILAPFIQ